MIDLTNWLRKNTGATETYYGYANPGVSTSDNKWLIRREITESGDTVYEYADNDFQFDKIWDNKELYFSPPASAVTLNNSAVTDKSIIMSFDLIPGVSKYYVTLLRNEKPVGSWNNQRVRQLEDDTGNSITLKIEGYYIESETTYKILIEARNREDSRTSTFTITTI